MMLWMVFIDCQKYWIYDNDLNFDAQKSIKFIFSCNFSKHFDAKARQSEALLVRCSPAISVARHRWICARDCQICFQRHTLNQKDRYTGYTIHIINARGERRRKRIPNWSKRSEIQYTDVYCILMYTQHSLSSSTWSLLGVYRVLRSMSRQLLGKDFQAHRDLQPKLPWWTVHCHSLPLVVPKLSQTCWKCMKTCHPPDFLLTKLRNIEMVEHRWAHTLQMVLLFMVVHGSGFPESPMAG